MKSRRGIIFIALGLLSTGLSAMTVEEYLNLVQQNNEIYQGSLKQFEGAALLEREGDTLFTPQLYADFLRSDDAKPMSPPQMVLDTMKTNKYEIGLSQEFSFGVTAKLGYELTESNWVGGTFTPTHYWDGSPKLELSVPLLSNFFGRQSKARKVIAINQRKAEKHGGLAQAKGILIEAENAYWRLSAAQENIAIQKQALSAAESIHSYVANKKAKNLGEESDVLQANALVQNYKFQVEQAENEERAAKRAFNIYLNAEVQAPVGILSSLDYPELEKVTIPSERPGDREDVLATKAQLELARASATVSHESLKPNLNLYGGYSLNGRDSDASGAWKDSHKTNKEAKYVGLRLNMPLNLSAVSDAREGARLSVLAADLKHKHALYSQDQEWFDLTEKFKDAQTTLRLARNMERVQKSKLDNERLRLRQGRTTTYQVLLFEQEYNQAQASKVRAATQIIALKSQVKQYQSHIGEGK